MNLRKILKIIVDDDKSKYEPDNDDLEVDRPMVWTIIAVAIIGTIIVVLS